VATVQPSNAAAALAPVAIVPSSSEPETPSAKGLVADLTSSKKNGKTKKQKLSDAAPNKSLQECNLGESKAKKSKVSSASMPPSVDSTVVETLAGDGHELTLPIKKDADLAKAADGSSGKAQKARLTDIEEDTSAMLSPIVGVMDVAQISVREAAVRTGVAKIDACAYMAAENGARLASNDGQNLDKDEAGALNLYTMESKLYPTMNTCLRSRDRSQLKPFFPFLKLMLLARAKLPKFVGTVWRGVKADLRKHYPKGKEVYWWAFSSTTQQMSTLTNPQFLGKKGVRTIFNLQVRSGVDIAKYSVFQSAEAEVLLFPGTKFRVVDSMDLGSGLYQVHLEEVPIPVSLME